ATEAIVRKCLAGEVPAPGARPAHRALELSDYEAMFGPRGIVTGIRHEPRGQLYQHVLGPAFEALSEPVRALHAEQKPAAFVGEAEVMGAETVFGRTIARLFGFPPAADRVTLKVSFAMVAGDESWTRDFDGRVLHSIQEIGRGRYDRLLVERFGPLCFGM